MSKHAHYYLKKNNKALDLEFKKVKREFKDKHTKRLMIITKNGELIQIPENNNWFFR